MKIMLIAALAAFTVAPIAGQAADKEVKNPHYAHACVCKHHQQVALFVSGRGIGEDRSASRMQTVVQVGNGQPITFYTGDR